MLEVFSDTSLPLAVMRTDAGLMLPAKSFSHTDILAPPGLLMNWSRSSTAPSGGSVRTTYGGKTSPAMEKENLSGSIWFGGQARS